MEMPRVHSPPRVHSQPVERALTLKSSTSSLQEIQRVHGDGKARGPPIMLGWRDLSFTIGQHQILKGISGMAQPGRLTAVMGPSGSGKTTLLNVLSARQQTSGRHKGKQLKLTGELLASGEPVRPSYFKTKTAYVLQDNALLDTETPRECLEFSAYLRLPRSVSAEQRKDYVEQMLQQLNIDNCADMKVGSALEKGLSGGEQKRTAVGVELISDPKLLLLDEPLSGLDSFNAVQLIRSLKVLASSGVPVVMTLHQPSSQIFAELDDLLILHAGQVVFNGPAMCLADYFKGLGFPVPPNYNPADHVMSVIQEQDPAAVHVIKESWPTCDLYIELLAKLGRTCNGPPDVEAGGASDSCGSSAEDSAPPKQRAKKGSCNVLLALLRRDARSWMRQSAVVTAKLGTSLVVALLYGWLFYGAGVAPDAPGTGACTDEQFDTQHCVSQFGLHVIVMVVVAFLVMTSSQIIAVDALHGYSERAVFLRERGGGYYGVIPYFLSKMFFELFWASIVALFSLLGTYWLVGLHGNFFSLFAGMMVLSLTCASPSFVVSAASSTKDEAMTLSTLPTILQFIFSGILVPISGIPRSLAWIKYTCPLYYGLRLLFLEEFRYVYEQSDLCTARNDCSVGTLVQVQFLKIQDVYPGQFWWPCATMCVVLFVVLRVLTVVILSRKTRFAV